VFVASAVDFASHHCQRPFHPPSAGLASDVALHGQATAMIGSAINGNAAKRPAPLRHPSRPI